MVGSQSAPIGTPPQKQICETAQYLAAVYGWGPASVLKHIRGALSDAKLDLIAPPRRPERQFSCQSHPQGMRSVQRSAAACRLRRELRRVEGSTTPSRVYRH